MKPRKERTLLEGMLDIGKPAPPQPSNHAHSPTPWKVDSGVHHLLGDATKQILGSDNYVIGWVSDRNLKDSSLRDADAAFIVKCVNAHEELLSIVKAIAEQFNEGANKVYRDALSPHSDDVTLGQWINNALAHAEGK